ncbi:alkaline ceramidase 1 [Thomomys bottae]
MPSIFSYQSSEVDWCEDNFQYSELVAEFYNTQYLQPRVASTPIFLGATYYASSQASFSNVSFLILGSILLVVTQHYAKQRTRAIQGVCVLFMFIGHQWGGLDRSCGGGREVPPLTCCLSPSGSLGLFSMYFHMTLSFVGQLLDELSILWLLASNYGLWLPRCYFPAFLKGNRSKFVRLVIVTTVISSFLSLVRPAVNAYALNSIALHILYLVYQEYKKTKNKELRHVIEICVVLWIFAMTCWISDRALCSFWQRIHFSYLHSMWHLFISATFPYGLVILVMVDTHYEMPEKTIKLRYWPRDTWPVGVPYVELHDNDKGC